MSFADGNNHVDAETLLRRVHDIVANAKPIPLSNTVRLDSKEEVLELLEEAIARLPDELREARWMLKEREEFLAKTQREAALGDDQVLLLIRDYLATSQFKMEGYRKVWAHFKFDRGLRIGKNRVLRIMRENRLLSPLRRPWREKLRSTPVVPQDAPELDAADDAFFDQDSE